MREREGGRSREAAEARDFHPQMDWSSMSDAELLRYYHKHYDGLSRGQLQKTDHNFYSALRRRGLLDEIPLAEGRQIWSSMSDRELLQYYHKHYEGLTRTELANTDRSLYNALRRRGLLSDIPVVDGHQEWAYMTDAELLRYYHAHYEGVSRGKLALIDKSFYGALQRRGLLHHIPLNGD